MDFFTKLGNKIQTGVNSATTKVKEMADTSSINRQIAADEAAIKAIIFDIGNIYYNKNKDNTNDEFADAFIKIEELKAKIEQAKIQIQQIKGTKLCTNCGAEIPNGVAFCSKCGAKAPEDTVVESSTAEEVIAKKVCPSCGNAEEEGVSFCSGCGCKLD